MVSELEARGKEERRNFSVTSRSMIAGGKRKICTGKLIFAKYILRLCKRSVKGVLFEW